MTVIDYFFSPLSPYAYLAGTRLEDIAARHGLGVVYKPLDLMSLFDRTGGTRLEARHPARLAYRAKEIARTAKRNEMEINVKPAFWPTNPAPAAYAIISAQEVGGGDVGALTHGLMRACFLEQKDIAQDDVIRPALEAAGFAPDVADKGRLQAAGIYTRNLEEASSRDVFGSPFYIAPDGEPFWGQDRLEDLARHLAGDL